MFDRHFKIFTGSDRSVMMRTQRHRYTRDNKRPAQIGCYVQLGSLFNCMLTVLIGGMFGLLAKFKFGRSLLESYPGFFSAGLVTKAGPSRERTENTNFEMRLFGWGWKGGDEEGLADNGAENRHVEVTVKGRNIG